MSTHQRKATATQHPQKALKISAKARYALRILKDIADHEDDALATTEAAIAKRQGLSEKFLSRIVLPLRDAKIVSVRRGSREGFSLLRKPEKISLLDIIETVQGPVAILDCLDASVDCGRKRNCFARRIWSRANDEIRRCLAAITLKCEMVLGSAILAGLVLGPTAASAETGLKKDIPYAEPADCRLDVKWPLGETGFPTVVWFHGGGLEKGSKFFIGIDDAIAQVAVNYRLLKKGGLTDGEVCISDAAAAVAWTLENIAAYGGDPKKVYVSGMSAGGYLTMMVGMAPKYLKERGHDIRELAGLAPVSGQATKHFNVRAYAGDRDPQYLPKIDALAPLAWCSKDLPPIVSICGQEPWEWPCRSEENRLLISSCVALGHTHALFVSCPYADHSRALPAGVPYVEMFVKGRLPPALKRGK